MGEKSVNQCRSMDAMDKKTAIKDGCAPSK